MISNKRELKEYIREDKKVYVDYIKKSFKSSVVLQVTGDYIIKLKKYVILLRKSSYYKNRYNKGNKLAMFLYVFWTRKLNRLGNKLGIYISPNADIGKGLLLFHHGEIIINGNAKIGTHCSIHGNCCIGNKGSNDEAPVLGNYVDIGFGTIIIGGVNVGDNVIIGAGSIVTHNFRDGVTIAGSPAKEIVKNGK